MTALAAVGQYDLDKGTLALSGSEPGAPAPHVVNDKIVGRRGDHGHHARRTEDEGRRATCAAS